MSAQIPGTEELPAGTAQPDKAPRALRVVALAAVCLGVAALAAATFALSYSGIRAVALQAGIAPRLARGYPLLVDAMLVIVLAAVLALRGAGLPSRVLAWLTLLVVLAAAAGADALHAAGHRLPHDEAAITAAVVPFVLVLLAFVLLLAMLRHARLRRLVGTRGPVEAHGIAPPHGQPLAQQAGAPAHTATVPALDLPVRQPQPPAAQPIVPGFPVLPAPRDQAQIPASTTVEPVLAVPRQPGPGAAADSDPGFGPAPGPDLAVEADLAPDDPSTDEAVSESDGPVSESTEPGSTEPGGTELADSAVSGDGPHEAASAGLDEDCGPSPASAAAADDSDPDMPVFHRMWSAPTPPADA